MLVSLTMNLYNVLKDVRKKCYKEYVKKKNSRKSKRTGVGQIYNFIIQSLYTDNFRKYDELDQRKKIEVFPFLVVSDDHYNFDLFNIYLNRLFKRLLSNDENPKFKIRDLTVITLSEYMEFINSSESILLNNTKSYHNYVRNNFNNFRVMRGGKHIFNTIKNYYGYLVERKILDEKIIAQESIEYFGKLYDIKKE